jgi:hypothetical protein
MTKSQQELYYRLVANYKERARKVRKPVYTVDATQISILSHPFFSFAVGIGPNPAIIYRIWCWISYESPQGSKSPPAGSKPLQQREGKTYA